MLDLCPCHWQYEQRIPAENLIYPPLGYTVRHHSALSYCDRCKCGVQYAVHAVPVNPRMHTSPITRDSTTQLDQSRSQGELTCAVNRTYSFGAFAQQTSASIVPSPPFWGLPERNRTRRSLHTYSRTRWRIGMQVKINKTAQ